jgi:hypothetical protein
LRVRDFSSHSTKLEAGDGVPRDPVRSSGGSVLVDGDDEGCASLTERSADEPCNSKGAGSEVIEPVDSP